MRTSSGFWVTAPHRVVSKGRVGRRQMAALSSASTSSRSRYRLTTLPGRQKDHAVRIKATWVAVTVVIISVGLLLVASLDDSLFIKGQLSIDPAPSIPPGTSGPAEPTAPSLARPTPSPPTPTTGMPSASPVTMPSEQPAPRPATSAPAPSVPSAVASPAAAAPSIRTAPIPSGLPAPQPLAPTATAPSAPPLAAPPALTTATPAAPPLPSVLPAEAEMSESDRRQVQEALHRLGYYKGPVDGILGPRTRAAIRRFQQQDIGSKATGHLTADQANQLVTHP